MLWIRKSNKNGCNNGQGFSVERKQLTIKKEALQPLFEGLRNRGDKVDLLVL
jgi:hypothetical protein